MASSACQTRNPRSYLRSASGGRLVPTTSLPGIGERETVADALTPPWHGLGLVSASGAAEDNFIQAFCSRVPLYGIRGTGSSAHTGLYLLKR